MNLTRKERFLQEDTLKSLQEIEEQMSFLFKRESQSTVNQLMVQIQELQDKVNSLNDSRDFFDLQTASSSGLSRVPGQPFIIPSLRGMPCRDSCLQPDTRNSFGIWRKVF